MYGVITGNHFSQYETYEEAVKATSSKSHIIRYYHVSPTEKQLSAVRFVEYILGITCKDLSRHGVSKFLSEYLTLAKQTYTELKSEYEADRGY